jgi:hypothetical protein
VAQRVQLMLCPLSTLLFSVNSTREAIMNPRCRVSSEYCLRELNSPGNPDEMEANDLTTGISASGRESSFLMAMYGIFEDTNFDVLSYFFLLRSRTEDTPMLMMSRRDVARFIHATAKPLWNASALVTLPPCRHS